MNSWKSLYQNKFENDLVYETLSYVNDTVKRSSEIEPVETSAKKSLLDLFMIAVIKGNSPSLLREISTLNIAIIPNPIKKEEFQEIGKFFKFGFEKCWQISAVYYAIYPPKNIDEKTLYVLKDFYRQLEEKQPVFSSLRHYRAVQICHYASKEIFQKLDYENAIRMAYFKFHLRNKNLFFLSKILFSKDVPPQFSSLEELKNILTDSCHPKYDNLLDALTKEKASNQEGFLNTSPQLGPPRIFPDLSKKFHADKKQAKKYQSLSLSDLRFFQCSLIFDETSRSIIDKKLNRMKTPSKQIYSLRKFIQKLYNNTPEADLLRTRASYAKEKIASFQKKNNSPKIKKRWDIENALTSKNLSKKEIRNILNDLDKRCLGILLNIGASKINEEKIGEIKCLIHKIQVNQQELLKVKKIAEKDRIGKRDLEAIKNFTNSFDIDTIKLFGEISSIDDRQYEELLSEFKFLPISGLNQLLDAIKPHVKKFERFKYCVETFSQKLKEIDDVVTRLNLDESEIKVTDVVCFKGKDAISNGCFKDEGYNNKLLRFVKSIKLEEEYKTANLSNDRDPSVWDRYSDLTYLKQLELYFRNQMKKEKRLSQLLQIYENLNAKIDKIKQMQNVVHKLYFSQGKFSSLQIHYQKITFYLISLILKCPPELESIIWENLISLCQASIERSNFHVAQAIFGALDNHDVKRLPNVKDSLHQNDRYEALQNLLTQTKGAKNYLQALKNSKIPPIPYYGEITQALERNEANIGANKTLTLKELKRTFLRRQEAIAASYPGIDELAEKTHINQILTKNLKSYLEKPEGWQETSWQTLEFYRQAEEYANIKMKARQDS